MPLINPGPKHVIAAAIIAFLTGCGGSNSAPPALSPASTTAAATGTGTLTLQFPTGFRTATYRQAGQKLNTAGTTARARPNYVNPTGSSLLDIYVNGTLITNLDHVTPSDSATVEPTADGTQTLSNVPLPAGTSDVTIVEWTSGKGFVLAVGENPAVVVAAGTAGTIAITMQMNAIGMALAEVADGAGAFSLSYALQVGIGSPSAAAPLYLFATDPSYGFTSASGIGGVPTNITIAPTYTDGSQFGPRNGSGYSVKYASPSSTITLNVTWSNPAGVVVANAANTELNALFPNPSNYGLYVSHNLPFYVTAQYLGYSTQFSLPNAASQPNEIVTGPDGNLWFTESTGNNIGRMTPGGELVEFAVPTANAQPLSITVGPDHNLWFTEYNVDKIGRITTSGSITEYSTPATLQPQEITVGPDNALWYSGYNSANAGRIDTSGNVTTFATGCEPQGITSAGGLIFLAQREESPPGGCDYISDLGWITTGGTYNALSLSYPLTPYQFALGTDGRLYFSQANSNEIGSVSVTGTNLQEYNAGHYPWLMTSGPDGAIWYVAIDDVAVARMPLPPTGPTPYTEFPAPAGSNIGGITSGSDGAIWFTAQATGKIIQLH